MLLSCQFAHPSMVANLCVKQLCHEDLKVFRSWPFHCMFASVGVQLGAGSILCPHQLGLTTWALTKMLAQALVKVPLKAALVKVPVQHAWDNLILLVPSLSYQNKMPMWTTTLPAHSMNAIQAPSLQSIHVSPDFAISTQ